MYLEAVDTPAEGTTLDARVPRRSLLEHKVAISRFRGKRRRAYSLCVSSMFYRDIVHVASFENSD